MLLLVVVLMLLLLLLFSIGTWRVGELAQELRLAAGHPGFVHTDFELTGPGDGCIAASVLVQVQGVWPFVVIVPGCA